MKYRLQVDVRINNTESGYSNPLMLSEANDIELHSLSDAAMILVKLHEFFEALRAKKS